MLISHLREISVDENKSLVLLSSNNAQCSACSVVHSRRDGNVSPLHIYLHMKHKHYKIQPPGPQCSVMADWEAVSQWPLTTDDRERGGRPGITMVTRCVTLRSITLTSPQALLLCPVTCILVSPMWIFVHVLVTLKYKAKSKWRTEKGRTHRARSARLAWILFHWKSANLPWKNRSCRIQTNRSLSKFLSKILPTAIPDNREDVDTRYLSKTY